MTTAKHIFKPSAPHHDTASARARVRLSQIAGVELVTPMDEVRLTQRGVSIATYEKSLKHLGAGHFQCLWVINPRTLRHRKSKHGRLNQEESGRWLRAAKIQALAEAVFGSQEKATGWLNKARRQFDGQSAAQLIETEAGAQLVEDTLNQIDSGYLP